ncbi:hypothetical protein HDU96_009314 [Phlyctochytrium bullatum]|nr:hypothetical protein HDU96_009314 [Phlyctochytrium bullatum]
MGAIIGGAVVGFAALAILAVVLAYIYVWRKRRIPAFFEIALKEVRNRFDKSEVDSSSQITILSNDDHITTTVEPTSESDSAARKAAMAEETGTLFSGMADGRAPSGPAVNLEYMEQHEEDKPSFLFGGNDETKAEGVSGSMSTSAGPSTSSGSRPDPLLREEECDTWGANEVGIWLEASGMNPIVIDIFVASDITGPVLLELDDGGLARMGFEKEEIRNMLLLLIYALRNKRRVLEVPPAYDTSPPSSPLTPPTSQPVAGPSLGLVLGQHYGETEATSASYVTARSDV